MEAVDVSVKWPFKWCLVGSSGSGKTMFSLQLIKNIQHIVDNTPSKIVIIYKEYQNIYEEFKNYFPTEILHEEEADIEYITKNNKDRLLLICDDLYFSKKLDDISEQFLVKGRHRNTSWLVLTQSIFNRPALINISRNCNHITLFKTVRLNEPHIFFSQLRPKASKVLQNIFAKATESSFSYIDIDLSQTCPDKYRYKTKLFDKFVEVFIIMNENTFKKMYLVTESDLKECKEGKFMEDNFKFSVENKDICNNGMNISVKPIKKRNSSEREGKDKQKDMPDVEDGQAVNLPIIDGKSEEVNEIKRSGSNDNDKETNKDNTDAAINQPTVHPPPIISADEKADSIDDIQDKKSNLKRKPLSLRDDPYFHLNKAKRFKPYTFLKENNKRRLLDEIDDNEYSSQSNLNLPEDKTKVNEEDNETEKSLSDAEDYKSANKNQWMNGIRSRLDDRKVQFKRKQDSLGYRIAPKDIRNSLIKPNDFTFLSPKESREFMDAQKMKNKQKNKRFRLY